MRWNFSDADLPPRQRGGLGAMVNSGQLCLSVERISVEETVYDEFVTKLTAAVGRLRQGADGRSPSAASAR